MDKVIAFLNEIGIKTEFVDDVDGSFLEHVLIESGGLKITNKATISNVLHEAGHIAIIPENLRHMANGNMDTCIEDIFSMLEGVEPDHPVIFAMMQCSDHEATAWAWSAGKHLNISEDLIIEDSDYENEGSGIRMMLRHKSYFGINGLSASGMIQQKEYPSMKMWTQRAIEYKKHPSMVI